MSAPPQVVDAGGNPVDVGGVVGRGGEGSVYEVRSRPDVLAKIYHAALSDAKAEKLRVMAGLGTPGLAKLTAWPSGMLHARGSGVPIGLLMPRVRDRKDVHLLYGPGSRKAEFPRADWRFLVRAAANTARAFAAVHAVGCVIGDVNHGGVLVAQDATVSLIDCDSFQVVAGGKRFSCDVGVETFTPPELQGRSFAGVLRTPDHDAFGLAVMAFLLLFMGKHPFSGRYGGPGDMPIGTAIRDHRFAYGESRKAALMEPPPGALPLSHVGEELAGMFELAFSARGAREGRPDARLWIAALERLERSAAHCGVQPSHWYPGHFTSCPWCKVEPATGTLLFPVVVTPGAMGGMDVEALWREILGLPSPGPVPVVDVPWPAPSSAAVDFPTPAPEPPDEAIPTVPSIVAGLIAFLVLALVMVPAGLAWIPFVGAIVVGVIARKVGETTVGRRNAAKSAHAAAERKRLADKVLELDAGVGRLALAHSNLAARWARDASPADFERKRAALESIRSRWADLPRQREQALEALRRDLRRTQLEAYLDRVDIASSTIDGIGPSRKQTLASYGIETARDVDPGRLATVPRFGAKTIERMVAWRRRVEAGFLFDPSRPVDPRQVTAIEQSILAEGARLRAEARTAHAAAVQAHAAVLGIRRIQRPQLEAAAAALAQAKADLRHLS